MAAALTFRRGLLLVAAAAAATGVLAGLARLGVTAWGARHAFDHGALMALGVFATVIGLERAVALGRAWAYAAPALGAAAAVAMLARLTVAPWIACASTFALVAVNAAIVRKQAATFTWLMLAAAVVLAAGTLAWARGHPVFVVVPAWLDFFVLTIAAERLELSRLAPTPRWAPPALLVAALASAAGAAASPALLGVSFIAIGGWQLAFDLARRTVRRRGLPRFSAASILLGSSWLVVTGVLLATRGLPPAGPLYDAALHGVFVGYVLSMIFAHAPIILPAVARVAIPFHPALWGALLVLHASLVARVAGDLALDATLRRAGSIGNAVALALFVLAVARARATASR